MTREAIVVGGGIGGLATAVALHRIGWRATVLERASVLAGESTVDAALSRYDADRRPRTQATARGARKDGHRTTSRAAHRAMVTMIRMMPASLWRKSIAPDVNPTWRWRPPPLPNQPTRS